MRIDFKKLLPESNIFCDYVQEFTKLASFYRGDPSSDDALLSVYEDIKKRKYKRESLCEILKQQNIRWGTKPDSLVMRNIQKLAEEDCVAVVTGQQTGLFGGPLYTLYKAITAILLSHSLEIRINAKAVPVFWIESDDHDFLEASSIKILDRVFDVREIKYESKVMNDKLPMSSVIIDDSIDGILEGLYENLPLTQYKQEIFERIKQFYFPGNSYIDAFAGFLHHLLGEYGLIMVSPSDPEIKKLSFELFKREIETAPFTSDLSDEAGKKLIELGYHPQIKSNNDRVNLFYHLPGRAAITRAVDCFVIESFSEKIKKTDLLKILKLYPEEFSSNVIMRPMMQDFLFPTLAYVAGPSEIAYWAQVLPSYEYFEIPRPVLFPRASITIMEGKVEKLIERYKLSIEELFEKRKKLVEEAIENIHTGELKSNLESSIKTFIERSCDYYLKATEVESNLKPVFNRYMGKIEKNWSILSRKTFAALNKKDEAITQNRKEMINNIFPDDSLQERTFNVLQYYMKYDRFFIERLFNAIQIDPPWVHQLISLDIEQEKQL